MTSSLTQYLLDHRRSGDLIAELPADLVPQSGADAYRAQDETVKALGPVGAWKVQPMPETGEPWASPILASTLFADGAILKTKDFPGLAIEVEVAVTLAKDLPAKADGYRAADMAAAIASTHIALEILASRYADRTKVSLLNGIADLQSSGGVVAGPAVDATTLPDFATQPLTLRMDGAVVAESQGNAGTDNMLAALAWLANHAASRNLPLKAGTIVITGARLGPALLTGTHVEAEGSGLGTVSVRFD